MRVEIAVAEKFGQEFGLVAGRIEVQSSPFYDRVDNSLTAVADESDGILAAAFQGENQRGCGDCDDDTERDGQRNADGDAVRKPRRCFLALLGRALSPPADLAPGRNFQAKTLRNFGPTMDIRFSELRARIRAGYSPGPTSREVARLMI